MARRILILEDDAGVRRQLRRALVARGCEVVETASVAGFMEAAAGRRYDACLLDLWLPDGNGLDAWARVRDMHGGTVAVAMSGEPTPEAAARARELGCVRLLAKPFDLSELAAVCPDAGTPAHNPNFSMR